jgi:hypothetical protein
MEDFEDAVYIAELLSTCGLVSEEIRHGQKVRQRCSESGLDPVDFLASGLEADAVVADFEMYVMGRAAGRERQGYPARHMNGFLSMGRSLAEISDVSVVAKLAPMTCTGVIVE